MWLAGGLLATSAILLLVWRWQKSRARRQGQRDTRDVVTTDGHILESDATAPGATPEAAKSGLLRSAFGKAA
jgi:hypothetical protein